MHYFILSYSFFSNFLDFSWVFYIFCVWTPPIWVDFPLHPALLCPHHPLHWCPQCFIIPPSLSHRKHRVNNQLSNDEWINETRKPRINLKFSRISLQVDLWNVWREDSGFSQNGDYLSQPNKCTRKLYGRFFNIALSTNLLLLVDFYW